jgi:hypothetical protein
MISSTYRRLLLVILISSLTEVCAYNTPWSLADNHACQLNGTLSSPDLNLSTLTITNLEGPPIIAPFEFPAADTTSPPPISSRLPRCPIVHHFSLTIYSHELGCNMSTIFPGSLQTTIPTVLSLLDFRAVLLRHVILHGPSSSRAHRVQGEDSPEACSHITPTIQMHTQVDLPTSRLNTPS